MKTMFTDPDDFKISKDNFEILINEIPLRNEIKEWLSGMFAEKVTRPDFKEKILEYIEFFNQREYRNDINAFKSFFLFDSGLLDCFDKDKIETERIKCIPGFFRSASAGNVYIFNSWVACILHHIIQYARENTVFAGKYRSKLQEIRKASDKNERLYCYLELLNLPAPDFESPPPSWMEIDRLICEGCYPFNLISEMEELPDDRIDGIPIFVFPRILLLPSLVYGPEIYKQLSIILDLIGSACWQNRFNVTGSMDKILTGISLPEWNSRNKIHWICFHLAAVTKDLSIIDEALAAADVTDIPEIFMDYLLCGNKLYTALVKDCLDLLKMDTKFYSENVRYAKCAEWLLSQFVLPDKHDCFLFLDYLKKNVSEASPEKAVMFQKLFYPSEKNVKNILNEILPSGNTKNIYDKFVDVIAQGMAAYPAGLILPLEDYEIKTWTQSQNGYDYDVFLSYIQKIKPHNQEEALIIAEYWYLRFIKRGLPSNTKSELFIFEIIESLIYEKIFFPHIDDENFVCRFLNIPEKHGKYGFMGWFARYLGCWTLKSKTSIINYNEAAKCIIQKKIIFPDIISESFRLNYSDILEFANDVNSRIEDLSIFLLAVYITVNNGNIDNKKIMDITRNKELQYFLCKLRYQYSHEDFIPEQFLEYLLLQKVEADLQSVYDNKCEVYPFDLLKYACEAGDISINLILKKIPSFIFSKFDNNPVNRLKMMDDLVNHFEYFLKTDENEMDIEQEMFISVFFEQAVNENESSFAELFTFLSMYWRFTNKIDRFFNKNPECLNLIKSRCVKANNLLIKTVNDEFPVYGASYHEKRYLFFPAWFLGFHDSIWKGLKPLIAALRFSKKPMIDKNLSCNPHLFVRLPEEIASFFHIKDKEKLKLLRRDMACDLINYLKPSKVLRNPENYTKLEQEMDGFDPGLIEPNPLWRYAYIRALLDLGVKTNTSGHFFDKTLEHVSVNDPSKMVREAAVRTRSELNNLRIGMTGADHKKCLYEAFWWMRQAHLLSLGEEINSKEANNTRILEWQR